MSQITTDPPTAADGDGPEAPRRPRRRTLWRVLIGLGVVVVVLVAAAAAWWTFGRDQARQVTTDEVLEDFRSGGATVSEGDGLPPVGVYAAVATGTEDVGVPGLTESLGPNAPVTVTHGAGGCFDYRVDFNSHHWRTWTFCPTADATFALSGQVGSTLRKIPGLDFGSVLTYTCETPVPFLWTDAAVGDRRAGRCSGTSDTIEGITTDDVQVEVLGLETLTLDGRQVSAVHIRSSETFGGAQAGAEHDEWWLDASNGLPLKLTIDSTASSDSPVGTLDYVERGTLELTSLVPTT